MENSRNVLDHFERISQIPRCSKDEKKIRDYLKNWAKNRGFASREDRVGNLLIEIPGTAGQEAVPDLVLQAHLDMVCEKTPESSHDFSRDPIRLIHEGEWLGAAETTLGADNGIGLALALALAEDPDLSHPPMELLFTVDEESGLTGAAEIQPGFFKGKILLNLDSEDEGVFTIGCAGGRDCELILPLFHEQPAENHLFYELKIGGLRGGHSGVDIHEQRGNANVLLARVLGVLRKTVDFRLSDIHGGSAHNAIPRQAWARLAVSQESDPKFTAGIERSLSELSREFPDEPGLSLTLEAEAGDYVSVLTRDSTDKVMDILLAAPNGVIAMSKAVAGLVETSVNFAKIRTSAEQVTLLFSQRSDRISALDWLTARLTALARLAGGRLVVRGGYPGWQPDPDSKLLELARQVYLQLFNVQPRIEVIHAGLECGLIGAKNPGLQMLSLGPTIRNPHSPQEKLHLPSLARIYRFLATLIASCSQLED